jgi:hypothetical protein
MSFAVSPKLDCPHVLEAGLLQIAGSAALTSQSHAVPCGDCAPSSAHARSAPENWVCLHCHAIRCSRHQAGHMQIHNETTGHVIVFSLSDASVWCYGCDRYLCVCVCLCVSANLAHERFPTVLHCMHFCR